MNRRAFITAVLGVSGCTGVRSSESERSTSAATATDASPVSTDGRPSSAGGSLRNVTFEPRAERAPPSGCRPRIATNGSTVVVSTAVKLPNDCYRPRLRNATYDDDTGALVVEIGANESGEADVSCPSATSYGSYRFEATLDTANLSRVDLRHPLERNATYDVTVATETDACERE
jgi:hypothetical protein